MILLLIATILFVIALIIGAISFFRLRRTRGTFAFFHPYCNAGGGGERVLWRAIAALQTNSFLSSLQVIIYTGDTNATPEQILARVSQTFNITIEHPENLKFTYLRGRYLLEPIRYPYFTLLAQALASILVGFEALWKACPEYFIDTTGFPFTLPIFKIFGGSRTLCYVHYPTITKDMIKVVTSRTPSYNNSDVIAAKSFYSYLKTIYYCLFYKAYEICGYACDVVMTNGSWSAQHIASIWRITPNIVFPPCNIVDLMLLENNAEALLRNNMMVDILSVGQIRPEKDHLKQIEIFAAVRRLSYEQGLNCRIRLLIAGGCRDENDYSRMESLKEYALEEFKLETDIDIMWHINVQYDELLTLYKSSLIGLHTMWNEHFGISIVEGMAAGNIMVANDSGGPKLDIIQNTEAEIKGYLATTTQEYASSIIEILKMSSEQRSKIRMAGRQSTIRFSESAFDVKFCQVLRSMIN